MNKFTFLILGILNVSMTSLWAQKIDAEFSYATFNDSKTGPYVEAYFRFNGNNMNYALNEDGYLTAAAELTMLFKNADEIKEYRRFKIVTPPLPDTTTVFYDMVEVQRIVIPNGVYNFDLIIRDLNSGDSIQPLKMEDIITVDFPEEQIALSGIEFIESYNYSRNQNIYMKGDYECIPFVSDNYLAKQNYLNVYAELYNASKLLGPLESFYFLFHIEQVNTSKQIKGFSYFERQKAYNKNAVFKQLNISKLPTGNYFVVMEIQDSLNNIVLSKRKHFKRQSFSSKPKLQEFSKIGINNSFVENLNLDSLHFYINSLYAISDKNEQLFIDSVLPNSTVQFKKQFLNDFWSNRDKVNPNEAWQMHLDRVKNAEMNYKTDNKHGFETARGSILIKYGMPNEISNITITDGKSMKQIWQYYMLGDKANASFVFKQLNEFDDFVLEQSSVVWENDPINGLKENSIE